MESSEPLQPVILLTGAYGLLGSRLLPLLAEQIPGSEIIAVGRNQGRACAVNSRINFIENSKIKFIHGDLRDASLWAGLPAGITHVFHLAAVIPWKAEDRYKASIVTDNLAPLANLIEHSRRWSNLRQVVYSSSVSVYAQANEFLHEDSPRRPANLYGASKLAGEDLLWCMEAAGVRTVSLRLSSLYACGQYEGTVLPIMVRRALNKQELVIFGDGTRTQDFLHCEDAARACLLCFRKEARGVYNIGTGVAVSMTELAETVSRVFANDEARIVYQPARGGENDTGLKLDVSRARRELGFEPLLQLESGLRKLQKEMEDPKA